MRGSPGRPKPTFLLIEGLLFRAWTVRALGNTISGPARGLAAGTYNHLLVLLAEDLALHHLDVLQAREDLVLDLEGDLHAEGGAFLDCEWRLLERVHGSGIFQVDDDVGAALNLETKGEDDAFARVVWIRDVLARAEAERLFPLAEGLVVLVWGQVVSD